MRYTAIDTETFLIYPGNLAPTLVCVSHCGDDESGLLHHADPNLFPTVLSMLEEHTVWANAPFDLAVLIRHDARFLQPIFDALDDGRIHDVQIRAKLIDITGGRLRYEEDEEGNTKSRGYSLAELSMRHLGVRLEKDIFRLNYHDRYDVPLEEWPEGAREYAISDARSTREVYFKQEEMTEYMKNAPAQTRAHMMLHLISCHGFRTDLEAVDRLRVATEKRVNELQADLQREGFVRDDGSRDTKKAIRRMLHIQKEQCAWTDSGQKALDLSSSLEDFLQLAEAEGKYVSVSREACLESGDDLLSRYSEYSQCKSLLSTAVKDLAQGSVIPIQPRYEVLMATTRTSCSGPNIQNQRRSPGVRECFVARPGHVILAGDYAAAELHTLAQVCYDELGKSKLGDLMNAGIDVHKHVGAQIIRLDYADVDLDIETHATARQVAKAANFGFPGGCSGRRFASFARGYGCNITEREGDEIKSIWLLSLDEMSDYFEWVRSHKVEGNRFTIPISRIDVIRGKTTYCSACNTPFQGLAAGGAKAAGWGLIKKMFTEKRSILYGSRILGFFHDEYLIEVPEEKCHESALALKDTMEQAFNAFVPDCPTTVEVAAMHHWAKKAKPVFTEGRLTTWN